MDCYSLGDTVDIPDGAYLAPDGIVIVYEKKLVATFDRPAMMDKWGKKISLKKMIEKRNPLYNVVEQVEAQIKGHKVGFQKKS